VKSVTLSLLLILLLIVAAVPASANTVGVDLFLGNSWHSSQPIQVGGHLITDPKWETRPFSKDAWYYVARIRWGQIEVELLHDKVYMGYDTPDVQGFNMSDGFNFLLMNHVQKWGPWEGRLGAGPVIVHPEGTVNGYLIGELGSPSMRVGGIGLQAAVGYRRDIGKGFSYIVEGKVTTAIVHLTYPDPVHEIYAPVTGYHLLLGVGYDL